MHASGFSQRNGLRFQPDSPLGKNDHGSGNFAGWPGCCRWIYTYYVERWSCCFSCGRLTAMGALPNARNGRS